MNHLAHLLLAEVAASDRVGALLGDFVKGDPANRYAGEWLRGIRLHRAVDSFTDGHTLIGETRARFLPRYRRFAGVLVDLYYDHFLARHWTRFHPQPLPDFADAIHIEIGHARPQLPERLQRFSEFMVAEQLLVRYAERELIVEVARRMSRRLSRPNALAQAATELDRLYDVLEADFLRFFPLALNFARDWDG